MPVLTAAQGDLLLNALPHLKEQLRVFTVQLVQTVPDYHHPRDVAHFEACLRQLEDLLNTNWHQDGATGRYQHRGSTIALPSDLCPIAHTLIVAERKRIAGRNDHTRAHVTHPEIIEHLSTQLTPFDELLAQPWLTETKPLRVPKVCDYLTLQAAESAASFPLLDPRVYDEKFGILQRSSLILPDLNYYRQVCALRGAEVTVAFVDLDDFKAFNTAYTEPIVDRDILTTYLRRLEAFAFGHGQAYKQGGDEAVIILVNVSAELAILMLEDLRQSVARLRYTQVEARTTLTIGFCSLGEDCFLTDREVLERASRAKKFGKESGKNCIASFTGDLYRDSDLLIASPRTPA